MAPDWVLSAFFKIALILASVVWPPNESFDNILFKSRNVT